MTRHFLYALAFLAALASWQGCKETVITPPFVNERDTVHSTVRATVNQQSWAFTTPDTLSAGEFDANGKLIRDDAITQYASCRHDMRVMLYRRSIFLIFNYKNNLATEQVIAPNRERRTLRSWTTQGVEFSFHAPRPVITTPAVFDSLQYASWGEQRLQETYRPATSSVPGSGTSTFAIYTTPIYQYSLTYDIEDTVCRIESPQLVITRYDTTKGRVSGTFRFRIINRTDGSVVDVKNGYFDNVYMLYSNGN